MTGGSHLTLDDLAVVGANTGGYSAKLAANDGIDLTGTTDTTLTDVSVGHVFGSGLDLEPLRSGSGTNGVVTPVTGLSTTDLSITAAGNQGIALVSVNGATLTDTTIGSTGQNPWDFEDDSLGVGAKNVTIDGCSENGLINISAGGAAEGPISISHCTSTIASSGDAVRVANLNSAPMGAVTFTDDAFRCAASAAVGCIQERGPANVNVVNCTLQIGFKPDTLREKVYKITNHSTLTFSGSSVSGVYKAGTHDSTSKVLNPIGAVL